MRAEGDLLTERDAVQERRRRTVEFGYRVCGLWQGGSLDGHPRICVMPRGHRTSPHRDVEGEDLVDPDPVARP